MNIPKHVAIIMDGNGRWATAHGVPKFEGHRQGVKAVREVVRRSSQIGVKTLTLFAFSTENKNRTEDEVGWLFKLFLATLRLEVSKLNKANIRLEIIGDLSVFGEKLKKAIHSGVSLLSSNTGMKLVIAANYGGQWDITQAVKKVAESCTQGKIELHEINEKLVGSCMCLSGNPVDLLIRSSGEQRISNFMLWHLAYSEMYFTNTLWPDFNETEFDLAIDSYQLRDRRFGEKH
ncbi:MAG: di-trans,poly-cis-decaprenylcistransferase [Candidatus Marinimicrobia bacterium]|jgi:undecaprenyl diphosphate synthase|nr:di-trans,poly-cis-decaprenylcistransferase [Candidatus Neomarinimicrobiota bacterium]